MTECTIKKDKNCKALVKDFLVLFLPCLWCHECTPSTASMDLWICKGEQPESPEHAPLTEAVLGCRPSLQREENFTSSLSLGPSLQPAPVVPEMSTSWSAAQHNLFWEHWQWPHTGLVEVITLGFMSSLLLGVKTTLSIPALHLCGLGENGGLKQWSCNMNYQEAC